jgi:hypothetical protein
MIELAFVPAGGVPRQRAQAFIKNLRAEWIGAEGRVRRENIARGEAELEEPDESKAEARQEEDDRKLKQTPAT